MKKLISLFLAILFGISIYFIFFHQDQSLKFISKDSDIIVLVDIKKMKRESFFSLVTHPSEWFKNSDIKNIVSSLNNSGIKTPDFLQIFHVENTPISHWNLILEIDNQEKFEEFLKNKKFVPKGNSVFQKDNFFIQLNENLCFVGTSRTTLNLIAKNFESKIYNANLLINGSSASVSFLKDSRKDSFAIEFNEDEIEISNAKNHKKFQTLITDVKKGNHFLNLELDEKNTRNFYRFFNTKISDSLQIYDLKGVINLESVNDTIVTYEYDDNFNEVEKKSFQKITQPNYIISAKSLNPTKTWDFLFHKRWINSENQMTVIPFQPNLITQNLNTFIVKSTRKPIIEEKTRGENYIYFKNDILLNSLLINFSSSDKKILSQLESVFYGNHGSDYLVKIKFKKAQMSLIFK